MKNSLKQLWRTPGKALLFFVLLAAVSFLGVFSVSMLSDTTSRIVAVEEQFTTLGTIDQPLISSEVVERKLGCYGENSIVKREYAPGVTMEELNFSRADYICPPENRPYFVANVPELNRSQEYRSTVTTYQIAEFTALTDSDEYGAAEAVVENVLYGTSSYEDKLEAGKELFICQCFSKETTPIKAGKRYVASLFQYSSCGVHSRPEYVVMTAPDCTQYAPDGERLFSEYFGEGSDHRFHSRVDEVTEGFWESKRGQNWKDLAEFRGSFNHLFYVAPTDSLELLPVFQKKQAYIGEGRAITEEEFESGAAVCLLPQEFAGRNLLKVGDKITLPLTYALYGVDSSSFTGQFYDFCPFDAEGGYYQPFFTQEYEIVGTYSCADRSVTYNAGELPEDMFLLPARSVTAGWENHIAAFGPMNRRQTTFQIKNGTVAEFDAALRGAVPAAGRLEISYNDNGYSEIMQSLQSAKLTALLLCITAALAGMAVVFLLLYFFIVKQKKRTAVERSLGMTKRQCRVSLISGVLLLALTATLLGGIGAGTVYRYADPIREEEPSYSREVSEVPAESGRTIFSTRYSPWAQGTRQEVATETAATPFWFSLTVPAALVILVLVLSLILIARNLKIEPIYLLSRKEE